MKRRGRPPHPDILTPREWEVLGLLRAGLSNPEIADRLGVTRDAVKYHVSEILSKLGVTSRDEAAVWRPYERPWWAAAVAALGGAATRLSPLGRIAAIGASIAALGGLALLAWGVWATSGSDDRETVAGSPSPGATASAETPPVSPSAPSLFTGVEMVPLEQGGPAVFPNHVSLIVETGCTGCGGPMESLVRMYRDAGGELRIEPLVTLDTLNLDEANHVFTGVAVAPGGSDIVVSACIADGCGNYDPGLIPPGRQTGLFRSTDGGVTWSEVGRIDASASIAGILADERVLLRVLKGDSVAPSYLVLPGLEELHGPTPDANWPAVLPDGRIGWRTDAGEMLLSDGTVFLSVNADSLSAPLTSAHFGEPFISPDGEHWLVSLTVSVGEPPWPKFDYLVEFAPASGQTTMVFQLPRIWLSGAPAGTDGIFTDWALDPWRENPLPSRADALQFGAAIPAVLDLTSRSIRPMSDLWMSPDLPSGRNHVLAVQQGPFARVINTDGTCVNIRSLPGSDSDILDCVAEGVLLKDLLELGGAEDTTWIRVQTPAGVQGWASVQYLKAWARS